MPLRGAVGAGRGTGRIGSIRPCAAAAVIGRAAVQTTPKRRRAGNMGTDPVRDARRDAWRPMTFTGGPARPFLGRRSALRVKLPRPTNWGIVPRYTYCRLPKVARTPD